MTFKKLARAGRGSVGAGLCLAIALGASGAIAGVSQEQADRLGGSELTPVGAERTGNAAGTIPEWTGGLTGPPENVSYQIGDHHPDPFADDAVLHTITAANAEQFSDNLTPGQMALLNRYDTYKMDVYPTHRSCAFPPEIYAATKRNAVSGQITSSGIGFENALLGVPFAIPENGLQMIWNHNMRFRGHKIIRRFASMSPTVGGGFSTILILDNVIYPYTDPANSDFSEIKNVGFKYVQEIVQPARRAGQIILVHEQTDPALTDRRAWEYTIGNRRVQRTTRLGFDNTQIYSDGLSTSDNFDVYSGSPERYNWQIVGKAEKYVPYNTYELASDRHKYADIAQVHHIKQDLVRYELHRVWVLEANLKEGMRHLYPRRIKYIDEDSWNIVAADLYDEQGVLHRVQEAHLMNYYEVPTCFNNSDIVYDLASGRYVVQNLKNEEPAIDFTASNLRESSFNPSSLRRRGVR